MIRWVFWRKGLPEEIPLEVAERRLRVLRLAVANVAVPVVGLALVLGHVWPLARARAMRILLQRHEAEVEIGLAAYLRGIAEVDDLSGRILADSQVPPADRLAKYRALSRIRDTFRLRAEAAEVVLARADAAERALPRRLWPWTPWTDPLTGATYPADASVAAMAADEAHQRLTGARARRYALILVGAARPAADPLPTGKQQAEN